MSEFFIAIASIIYLAVLLIKIQEARNADKEILRLDKLLKLAEEGNRNLSIRLSACKRLLKESK